MYAFMGVVPWKDAIKGRFRPYYVVSTSKVTGKLIMRKTKITNMRNSPPVIVNNLADADAQNMIAYACSTAKAVVDTRGNLTTIRARGLLLWYECDIYARTTGQVLFICTLPNYEYRPDPGPAERPLSWRMAAAPLSESLKLIKPILAQKSRPTKEKEKSE